jgi:hypothetical protein
MKTTASILDLADAVTAAKVNFDDTVANPNKTDGQIRAALDDLLLARRLAAVAAVRHREVNAALRSAAVEVKETCGLMWISSGDKHAKLLAKLPAAVAKVNALWEQSCGMIGTPFKPLAAGEICDLCDYV